MAVVVDRHLAEQNQVPAAGLELGRDRLRARERIGGDLVDLQQDTAVRTHRERRADRLLRGCWTEADHRDLSGARFLFAPEGLFDREFVVGV